ncbi:hypothetical protein [Blastococcus xanthinilyticus]|uniref:Uncharacterized protein n=1 Tax=Blastococcus xanthinilyticus TaxID=1564164 RepID=A0A5S5CSY8_9ACTN|nr:hypothetical protein [Blastococcus xanthinilyticus]TYP86870.1 hypothetical protein BD833_108155 [Blastococcus xanthinilyticus]
MAVHAAVTHLQQAVRELQERVQLLARVTDDHPGDGESVVVDLVRDACDDVQGWLAGLAEAAQRAATAAARRDRVRLAEQLAACATACETTVQRFVTGLAGVESLTRLRRLAHDRPGGWQEWSWQVQDGIGETWPRMWALRSHLDGCWMELVERLQDEPVLVRAQVEEAGRTSEDAAAGGR